MIYCRFQKCWRGARKQKIHNLHAKSPVSHISLKSPPIRVISGAAESGKLPAPAGSFCELFWRCLYVVILLGPEYCSLLIFRSNFLIFSSENFHYTVKRDIQVHKKEKNWKNQPLICSGWMKPSHPYLEIA